MDRAHAAAELTTGEGRAEELRGHVIICNCNEKVPVLVEELHRAAPPLDVVLLVQSRSLWEAHPEWHPEPGPSLFLTVDGSPTDERALLRAGLGRARAAVILADPAHGRLADARSTLVALAIEQRDRDIHTVMELFSSLNRDHLRGTEVNEVICLGELSEKMLAQACISPGIQRVFAHVLIGRAGSERVTLAPVPRALAGTPYRAVARRVILRRAPFILCGYLRLEADQGALGATSAPAVSRLRQSGWDSHGEARLESCFVINPRSGVEPGKDTPLKESDLLVLLARDLPALEPYFGVD